MRLRIYLILILYLTLSAITPWSQSCIFAQEGQDPKVSVGAVTKYTGPFSASDRQRNEDFLAILETQLAAKFATSGDVEYLDRSNLDAIFREQRLSSASLFDASTGAMKGLLGRLDFLIVAESSSPTLARVRVLDVETGAVKVSMMCQPRTTIFGGLSTDAPECVPSIVAQTSSLAKARLALKQQRLTKAAAAEHAAEEQRAKLEQQEREEERERAHQEQIARQQQADQERTAQKEQAAEQMAAQERQAKTDRQINAARPQYEDAIARLSGQTAFWKHLSEDLRRQGGSLRPEIESALSGAQATANRCSEFLAAGKPDALNTCVDELSRKLNQLEKYK